MAWASVGLYTPIAQPVETWRSYSLPPVSGVLNYGFRCLFESPLPATWQTLGFWAVSYTCDDLLCVTATASILYLNGSLLQPVRVLGASEVDFAAGAISSFDLLVSFNRWVPVVGLQILALT
jgi:hypothetical protein